jgi:hypothetical protein
MIVEYYILKKDISQTVLEQYGYTRPNENCNYCKYIRKDDRFVIITINRHTGRLDMRGYYYNISIEDCIKDLIKNNLVEAVELDYNNQVFMEDPDEFEYDVVIGLGEEMLR